MRTILKLAMVLIVVAAPSLVSGCKSKQEPVKPEVVPAPLPAPIPLPHNNCLTDDFGIPRKVILTDEGIRATSQPGAGAPVGPAQKVFWPYFVFDVEPKQGPPRFYRIGDTPQSDSIRGWVSADLAASWPTRIGGEYFPSFPLLIYKDKLALIELVQTGATKAKPIARATQSKERKWMPWPIAETHVFTHEGKTYELARLLFLGEFKEGSDLSKVELAAFKPGIAPAEAQRIANEVRKLDIVFVVDNTASTFPFLNDIRTAIEQISRQLQGMGLRPDISFGLVLYRDYVPKIMFKDENGQPSVVKVFPFQSNIETFLNTIRPLQSATDGSEDWPEAGYDGVHAGLTKMAWRGEGLSERILLWIGDNSAHEPGHRKNPHNIGVSTLASLAAKHRVRIFSLCIKGGGEPEEQRLHWEQCAAVAKGARGACFSIAESGKVVAQIRSIFNERSEQVVARVEVIDGKLKGKTDEQIMTEKSMDPRRYSEVMEFFKEIGLNPNSLGPNTPHFATGWCLTEMRGKPLLEKKVFIARPELDLLLAELNTLIAFLSPDIAKKSLDIGFTARVDPRSFFGSASKEPMNVWLGKKNIPSCQGLLQLTREEIDHMPEERRAWLREKLVRQIIPQLSNARTDDQIFMTLNNLDFGWVKESLFP